MEWINEIFARFTLIYKHFWTDSLPTELVEAATKFEWAATLHDLTHQQIRKTIDFCKANIKYPPLLPEFRQLALYQFGNSAISKMEDTVNYYRSLKRSHPQVADRAIEKCYEILTNKNIIKKKL